MLAIQAWTGAGGCLSSFFLHAVHSSPASVRPEDYRMTVVGNMVNIKFCGKFATKKERIGPELNY
jgi:hypothetical protein